MIELRCHMIVYLGAESFLTGFLKQIVVADAEPALFLAIEVTDLSVDAAVYFPQGGDLTPLFVITLQLLKLKN
jgi:hypothetical protein